MYLIKNKNKNKKQKNTTYEVLNIFKSIGLVLILRKFTNLRNQNVCVCVNVQQKEVI